EVKLLRSPSSRVLGSQRSRMSAETRLKSLNRSMLNSPSTSTSRKKKKNTADRRKRIDRSCFMAAPHGHLTSLRTARTGRRVRRRDTPAPSPRGVGGLRPPFLALKNADAERRLCVAREPGVQEHGPSQFWRGLCSWIPGSPLRGAPE